MAKKWNYDLIKYPMKSDVGILLPRLTLGQMFRNERNMHGLSSQDMAKKMCLTKGYYCQLEKNIKRTFKEDIVKKFHKKMAMICCPEMIVYRGKNIPKVTEDFLHSYGEFVHPFIKIWIDHQPKFHKYDFYKMLFDAMIEEIKKYELDKEEVNETDSESI